jgi:parallel beta-helix repeat protein
MLKRCIVLYGGSGGTGNIMCDEDYWGGAANPTIENCRISNSSNYGMYIENSNPKVRYNLITQNETGIYCIGSNPTIKYDSIRGNSSFGIYNETTTITIDAINNWWGYCSGPYHPVNNSGGLGDRVSDYVNFNPWISSSPSSPNLISPPNGALNVSINPTLNWATSICALKYHLEVSIDSSFTSIVFRDTNLTTTSIQIGPLLYNSKYYWRIRAKNNEGTSNWSDIWFFKTIIAPPSVPILVLPVNGAINQPITLTLKWNTSVDASLYRLQVATNSAFTTIVYDDSTITDTSNQVGPLFNNTLYYWRVNAKNVGGTSAYSTYRNFTTIVQLPSQVLLLLPLNGATVNTDSVNCVWQKGVPAITAYWYERATDSLFTINRMIDSSLIDSSYITHNLVNGQTYWWMVKAKNAAGWGPFSEKRKFNAIIVAVNDEKGLPLKFSLEQNYPNPFNPSCVIQYALPERSQVILKVYSLLGQEIATLVSEDQPAGYYEKQFDANGLPSGIYIYRIATSSGFIDMRKMLLLR